MASKTRMLMPSDRVTWTFGQALEWHLERGTRPSGATAAKGVPWTNKDFARAVGKNSSEGEKNERTIRNWRNGDTAPSPADFHAILLALFGASNADYAEWKNELTDKYHAARPHVSDDSSFGADTPRSAAVPTRPLRCMGRDDDLKSVVDGLTGKAETIAILVLGGAGMGKTTLTRQAANDEAVVGRFQNRRWFVELETAADAQDLKSAIINALGLDPAASKFEAALAYLAREPGLLILDNLETPWDAEREKAEAVLATLHQTPSLVLLASIRGNEPPGGLRWTRQSTMHALAPPYDRDLFLDIAKDIKPDDPKLIPLLTQLGGVPLAIELVAMQAAPGDTMSAIYEQWRRVGIALAQRRGVEPSRLTSLEKSLELSFSSSRLGDAGRQLFAILGQLPAGITAADLDTLLRNTAFEARQGLLSSGLGIERSGRLDLLPPVRDHAKRLHPPANNDATGWWMHFLALAAQQDRVMGTTEGGAAIKRLAAELPNFDAAVRAAITAKTLKPAASAWHPITVTMISTGLGSTSWARELASACHAAGEIRNEANCHFAIGWLAHSRSDHYTARRAFEQALPLYRQVGDIQGEAGCIGSLGDIALERSDHDTARRSFEQALPLFRQVGDVHGEATCIQSLGDIALARSDHDAARRSYEQALAFYRQVGDILGEANCIFSLGDIALACSDHDTARRSYEQALAFYRQVGDILGEANCIQGLGDIALARSDHDAARNAYQQAFRFYERHGDPYSIGFAHRRLARLSDGTEKAAHLSAARDAWLSIDRPDLVALLDGKTSKSKNPRL